MARSTGRRSTRCCFGTPDVYPDFNTHLADQQHALQHELDADRLADTCSTRRRSPGVQVYGNLPLNRPDVPGIQVTGIERYQTTWGPNDFVQNNFEWRDVLSWTRRPTA